MINIGIYLDPDSSDMKAIGPAISYLKDKHTIVSAHIFSDLHTKTYLDMACLSSFYMSYYKEYILFTNLEDFLSNQYQIISTKIYIATSKKQLEENYIQKKSIDNAKFLIIENGDVNEL